MDKIKLDKDLEKTISNNGYYQRLSLILGVKEAIISYENLLKAKDLELDSINAFYGSVNKDAVSAFSKYEEAKRKLDEDTHRFNSEVAKAKSFVESRGFYFTSFIDGEPWTNRCELLFTRKVDPFITRCLVRKGIVSVVPKDFDFPVVDAVSSELKKDCEDSAKLAIVYLDKIAQSISNVHDAISARKSAYDKFVECAKKIHEGFEDVKRQDSIDEVSREHAYKLQRKRWEEQDKEAAALDMRMRELSKLRSERCRE